MFQLFTPTTYSSTQPFNFNHMLSIHRELIASLILSRNSLKHLKSFGSSIGLINCRNSRVDREGCVARLWPSSLRGSIGGVHNRSIDGLKPGSPASSTVTPALPPGARHGLKHLEPLTCLGPRVHLPSPVQGRHRAAPAPFRRSLQTLSWIDSSPGCRRLPPPHTALLPPLPSPQTSSSPPPASPTF